MSIKTIGIDLGQTACDVVARDGHGKVVRRRRLSRPRLLAWLANLPPARIGMAAACGAHHLARRLAALGHDVRLMPAQYVRRFVKTNKHDQAAAAAICAAVQRPQMRFLGFQTRLGALAGNPRMPIKSAAPLDLQALHRARDRLVTSRTGLINQIRAFLLERGITVRPGRAALATALPEALEATAALSPMIRTLLARLRAPWQALDDEIAGFDQHILSLAQAQPPARRLMTIPGSGGLIATALVAAISLPSGRRSRTRGPAKPLTADAISPAGSVWCRGSTPPAASPGCAASPNAATAISGGSWCTPRALKRHAKTRDNRLGAWLRGLQARAHPNVATVALAAKLARWAWAVLAKNQPYRPAAA